MEVINELENTSGFTKDKLQIGIGDISQFDDHIVVETLAGCDRSVLLKSMQKIADEYGKKVEALFQDKKIEVEPESKI